MPSTTSCLNHYNTNPPVSVARKKLKILVLGGAGAGKTSILRRYFRGTFHQERIPTMGSDFYTRQVPNPSKRKNGGNGDDANDKEDEEEEGLIQQPQQVEEELKGDVAARVSPIPPNFATAECYQQAKGPNHNAPSSYNPDDPFASAEFISIQVWDTPGRERFTGPNRHKAKYTAAFSDKFFQNANAALLVYDFTSSTSFTQLLHWHADLMERMQRLEETQQVRPHLPILIVANKMDLFAQQQQQQQQLLLQRQQQLRQQKQEIYRNKMKNGTGTNPGDDYPNPQPHGDNDYYSDSVPQRDVMGFQGNSFRGKDSRYEYRASSNCSSSNSSPRHQSKHYTGLSSLSPSSSSSNLKSTTTAAPTSPRSKRNKKKSNKKNKKPNNPDKRKNRFEISTYMGTGGQTSYLKAVLSNECVRGSYLESLLSTEDRSHPDKDMVLLWCMRNGLKHVEVSALDGSGMEQMMEEAVKLAMESSASRDGNNNNSNNLSSSNSSSHGDTHHHENSLSHYPQKSVQQEQPSEQQQQHVPQEEIKTPQQQEEVQKQKGYYHYYRRNQELDLTQRYAPKDNCWMWTCLTRGPFQFCKF